MALRDSRTRIYEEARSGGTAEEEKRREKRRRVREGEAEENGARKRKIEWRKKKGAEGKFRGGIPVCVVTRESPSAAAAAAGDETQG